MRLKNPKSIRYTILLPLGNGLMSTGGALSPRSPMLPPPRLLVKRTGGAGGLSSSLDITVFWWWAVSNVRATVFGWYTQPCIDLLKKYELKQEFEEESDCHVNVAAMLTIVTEPVLLQPVFVFSSVVGLIIVQILL